MSSQDDKRKLITNYSRRLQLLKERQAIQGISADPAIAIEIEDIEEQIERLQAESVKNYSLPVIRKLLTEAFSAEELRRFLYDQARFRPVYESLSSATGKSEMIDRLLEYSERQVLISDLLTAVRLQNPRQYLRYEDELFLKEPSYETTDQKIEGVTQPETYTEPLENPYIAGNPVLPDNVKVFLGRFDIAEAIANEFKKVGQKPSILLYGRRRMGKTSALYNINRLVQDPNFLTVYISGQDTKFHTNLNFCYYLVQAINQRLQLDSIDTSAFQQKGFLTKNTFIQDPILTLAEFFEECHELLELYNKYCLLSIDEYEEIDRYINPNPGDHHERSITRELLLQLRHTLQYKTRFIFLFAGTHFLRDLSTVNWSETFINLKTLPISFLGRRDGYRLLTEPVPEMKYQDKILIEQILDITGCQPFLLQAVSYELVNTLNSKDTKTVTEEILNEAINRTVASYNTYFDYVWDTECTDEKHKKLLKVVTAKISGTPENELAAYQDELRDLIRREVLKKENGIVKFTMPIVKLWMKKNQHIL
jgi:hypothetical protein